ncbi:CsbD family protein [Sphingomonas sp. RB3P16]|uniref:CsbD family protein n=1 Tax=Parasphingomonas frigoris TaxID=3096163 RepID=UPI002FC68513
MNKDEFQGGARYVGGKVEKAVGDTVSSRDWQVDGVVDQVAGGAQNLYGRAKSAIEDAVDGAPELADKIGSEAREAGDRAADAARDQAGRAARMTATLCVVATVMPAILTLRACLGLARGDHGGGRDCERERAKRH